MEMVQVAEIRLRCQCGKTLRGREDLRGKKVCCPACRAVISVPALEAPTPEIPPLPREEPVREEPERSPRNSTGGSPTAGQSVFGVLNLLIGSGYVLLAAFGFLSSILMLGAKNQQMTAIAGQMTFIYLVFSGLGFFGGLYLCIAGVQALNVRHSKVRASSLIALLGLFGAVAFMLLAFAVIGNGMRGIGFWMGLIFGIVYLFWPVLQYVLNRFVLFAPPKVKPRCLDRVRYRARTPRLDGEIVR